jgi:hypothetical protein
MHPASAAVGARRVVLGAPIAARSIGQHVDYAGEDIAGHAAVGHVALAPRRKSREHDPSEDQDWTNFKVDPMHDSPSTA